MIVTAVNAHTGELAAFDRDSGVDLVDAVTASTALPGLVPTVSINGMRYIDGGVCSPDNADLASGYANVVVLSPLGGRSQTPPQAGQFEGLRRPPEWGTDLASQVHALRQQGSRVQVITPDADSRAAMGTNQMDPATRIPAARAGFAPRQAGSDPRDVPLTIARRRPPAEHCKTSSPRPVPVEKELNGLLPPRPVHHAVARLHRTQSYRAGFEPTLILVVNSGSCGEPEFGFQAGQVACPLPV